MISFPTVSLKNIRTSNIIQAILYLIIMIGLSFGAAYGIEFVKSQPLLSTTSRYGMKGSVVTLNPLFIRPYTAEHAFSRLMFKGLFTYDSGGMITGDLASSWEFIEEGKVLEVSLAEGLEWSDGTPITAQDVAFTYSIVQNDEYVGWADGFFNKVEIIASEDGSSVTFRLPSAYVPILDTLTLPVLPEHVFAEKNLIEVFDQRFLNDPVTSNEYRLTSYLQTPPTSDQQWQELTFKSSTENQEFQVRLYPTLEQISSAFTFGELDGFLLSDWWGVDAMLETISIGPKDVSLTGHYYSLIFNTEREISLEDRKALSSNLDRGQIPGLAASGPIPSNSPYWTEHAELRVGFDPAAQGTLSGKEFTIATLNQPEMKQLLQQVKAQLEERGAVIKELYLSIDEFQSKVLREHDFDVALVRQYVGLDPDLYSFWHSSQIDAPGLNIASLKNRRVDKTLEQGRTITNIEERKGIYSEFQQYFLEEYPAVYITHPPVYVISRTEQLVDLPESVTDLSDVFRYIQ